MQLSDFPARFQSKIIVQSDGCWRWAKSKGDYGHFALGDGSGKQTGAHRWAYWFVHGWWSTRQDPLDHYRHPEQGCIGPPCVNPDHVRPSSSRENTLRGMSPAAANLAKSECDHGHEFTPENTGHGHDGRYCKACHRVSNGWQGDLPKGDRSVCPAGHSYSGDNLYIRPDGRGRDCRACKRNRQRNYSRRRRIQ